MTSPDLQDPNFVTNFGLDVLKSLGTEQSFVFSPLSVLLSLAVLKLDNDGAGNWTEEVFKGAGNQEILDFVKKYNVTGSEALPHLHLNWKYPVFQQIDKKPFVVSKKKFPKIDFLSVDPHQSKQLYQRCEGFQYIQDETLKVLSIPYSNSVYSLVLLLPVKLFDPGEAIKPLDAQKLEALLDDLTFELIKLGFPAFHIKSNLQIHGIDHKLSIQITRNHTITSRNPYHLIRKHRNVAQLHRPGEIYPIDFIAFHPFYFAVLNGREPVVMGFFSGKGA